MSLYINMTYYYTQVATRCMAGSEGLECWKYALESRRRNKCLCLVSVVCCQVEVSAVGWSLVQRSPTDCVYVCVSLSVTRCKNIPPIPAGTMSKQQEVRIRKKEGKKQRKCNNSSQTWKHLFLDIFKNKYPTNSPSNFVKKLCQTYLWRFQTTF